MGRGDHVSRGCPALPGLGGDGAGHPRPLCGSGWTYHKVACHMQSVIAGCKAVLPPLPSAETSTTGENFAFPVPRIRSRGRFPPSYSRFTVEKGRMEPLPMTGPARGLPATG